MAAVRSCKRSFSHFDRVMMATEVARRLGSPAMARRFLRWRYPRAQTEARVCRILADSAETSIQAPYLPFFAAHKLLNF